jgi:hypothetical protein
MGDRNEPYVVGFWHPEHLMRIMKDQYCRSLFPHTAAYDDTACKTAINQILNEIVVRPSDIVFMPTPEDLLDADIKVGKLRHGVSIKLGTARFTFPQDTLVWVVKGRTVLIHHTKRGKPVLHGVEVSSSSNRTSSFYRRRQTNSQTRRNRQRRTTRRRAH